jgi:hypothetical protein
MGKSKASCISHNAPAPLLFYRFYSSFINLKSKMIKSVEKAFQFRFDPNDNRRWLMGIGLVVIIGIAGIMYWLTSDSRTDYIEVKGRITAVAANSITVEEMPPPKVGSTFVAQFTPKTQLTDNRATFVKEIKVSDLAVGQIVRLRLQPEIRESFPPQTTAVLVEVVPL